MIAVIFEVEPKENQQEDYFTIAASLKDELSTVPGFISVERFQSLNCKTKYLSLSFWQDELSVKAWRNKTLHQKAQTKGRKQVFQHYRLRVASVIRDYGLHDRTQAPKD